MGSAGRYDRTFILYFAGDDKVAENNAESLLAKAGTYGEEEFNKTTVIELQELHGSGTYDLSSEKPLAQGSVRVYVVGHGTDTSQTVGGLTPADLARTIDTLSEHKIARVSIVACHAGGDGNAQAPHRFVEEFWNHAKGFVSEVSGYTGTVHTKMNKFSGTGTPNEPKNYFRYTSWSGKEWWVRKGTVKKVVGHEHDEGKNIRKVYFSAKGGAETKGWTGKNM